MLHIDIKYTNFLSTYSQIRNFKKINHCLWRFSCFYCGDSKSNKIKARGFIFKNKDKLCYKCHNCGISKSFSFVLKDLDLNLYKEYRLERYKENVSYSRSINDSIKNENQSKIDFPVVKLDIENLPIDAICVDQFPSNHPVISYLEYRCIPKEHYKRLFFVAKFKEFANKLKPFCIKNLNLDHPRLVIPFYDEKGKIFAFQGRSFGNEKPKYITIKLDENKEKLYGLERIDFNKRIYVTEGPIDSLFLPNALAISGGAVNSKILQDNKNKIVVIMDNEPRNKQITNQVSKCIDLGYSVCLLPKSIKYKDINDIIKSGMSQKDLLTIIDANTYSGLKAKLNFTQWRIK